jgi:hypothetical protein
MDRNGRDQHLAARQPGSGIDHEVANHPGIVFEVEVLDVSDLAIGGTDLVVFEVFQVAQHEECSFEDADQSASRDASEDGGCVGLRVQDVVGGERRHRPWACAMR